MAVVSRLLRAARNASLASRAAAAAASRAAAMASRSARAAAAAAATVRAARLGTVHRPTRDAHDAPRRSFKYICSDDYAHLPDDAKTPTDKDLESDEAVWALYERWCKAFNKERDHAEMARRFKLFRFQARGVYNWNTHVPPDPEEAAIHIQKKREVELLLSKGEDVSNYEEWHLPMELGPFADGGDPFLTELSERMLKILEEKDPGAVQDVTESNLLGKSQTLNEMK